MLERVLARWPLKLLALALAFFTWLIVTGENRILSDFTVPLDIQLGETSILTGSPPRTVTVGLRGSESSVRSIDPLDLTFQVDLKGAEPGERPVLLSPADLAGVPRGVEVSWIDPDRVSLTVERRMRRVVPVVPSIQGHPPEGFTFYDALIMPESLEVEGPQSAVEPLTRLRTEPILLDERTEPFSLLVAAVPDSPEVRVLDSSSVQVLVEIDKAPVEATFEDVPVVLAGQIYDAAVKPSAIVVTLSAPPGLLARIGTDQVRAVADVSGLAPGRQAHDVPVRIEFVDIVPRDLARIQIKSTSRREVSVQLSVRQGSF